MKRVFSLVIVLAVFAVALLAQEAYRVTRVIDGDTLVLERLGTVRLIGVDAPETVDPRKPVQAFGAEAAAFLRKLVTGKVVRVEYDQQRTDNQDRVLAYLYLPDETFVNAEIVRQGYGHAYTAFPFKCMTAFRVLERQAMENKRGLWGSQAASLPSVPAPTAEAVAPPAATRDTSASTQTVYVTRTGTKYHRAGCRYLARSQIPMPLKDAAARYGPCSVCQPPRP